MTQPAPAYTPCRDLWCVTTYFNPAHYRTRRANFEAFVAPVRAAHIPVLTVECAVGGDPFELPPGPDVVQVRGPHILWQKERLINLAIAHLPSAASKVAWLDGDILFSNPDWALETATQLETLPVVQPFSQAVRLKRGALAAAPDDSYVESFASVWQREPGQVHAGDFHAHGHTGFAWAAQRRLLGRHGLYEAALNGNGDHLIAHAMVNDLASPCIEGVLSYGALDAPLDQIRSNTIFGVLRTMLPHKLRQFVSRKLKNRKPYAAYRNHFLAWAQPFGREVAGQMGCVEGTVLHLWHGDGVGDRGHGSGRIALFRHGFDPAVDLRIGPSGCLEWANDKPLLQAWAQRFFAQRREDGL